MTRPDATNTATPVVRQTQGTSFARTTAGSLNALAITLFIQTAAVAAVLAPAVIAPSITTALRLPVSAIGVFVAMIYLSAISAALYSGALIEKWGAIRTSQIGLLLCAAGSACVASGVIGLAVAGAVLIGLGYGPITPASSHILIRTTAAHRLSVVFSIKQAGVPLGGVVVGLAVPPQEAAFGWAWAILSISVACAAMAMIAQTLRTGLDSDRGQYPSRNFVSSILAPIQLVLSHRGLLALSACSFIFSGVQLSLSVNLSSYLNLDLGWSLLAAGVVLSAMQIAGMAGRILWGAISDAGLGSNRTLVVLALVMAVSCVATSLFRSDTNAFWIYAVLIVFGASAVGWTGVYLAEVARLVPESKVSIATGGTLSFTFLGVVFWTPIFGLIANASGGYDTAYLSLCVPLIICLWLLKKNGSG